LDFLERGKIVYGKENCDTEAAMPDPRQTDLEEYLVK
jgi:hypothetical protein